MAHEGFRVFWKKCKICGAVETSLGINGDKKWDRNCCCSNNTLSGICPICANAKGVLKEKEKCQIVV